MAREASSDRFDGYGEVPGIEEGTTFRDRDEVYARGVHKETQRGIAGWGKGQPAQSIVISGGYEDEDHGDVIIYTGEGGREGGSKRHTKDQTLTAGNAGLVRNHVDEVPIRVIRGAQAGTNFSPEKGYRYDGLYTIEDHWSDTGRDGYLIWRFDLRKRSGLLVPTRTEGDTSRPAAKRPSGQASPGRHIAPGTRVIRDPEVARWVKEQYDRTCQICRIPLEIPGNARYSETAHIRGVGYPHNGPDEIENALCLCPNHHKLFDYGAITIDESLRVINENTGATVGILHVSDDHRINFDHLEYHRNHHRQRTAMTSP